MRIFDRYRYFVMQLRATSCNFSITTFKLNRVKLKGLFDHLIKMDIKKTATDRHQQRLSFPVLSVLPGRHRVGFQVWSLSW